MTTTITNSKLSATINHKGAELISLQTIAQKREYIWEGNPEFWDKHSPILFPIVGTLKNNSYTFKNKIYHLSRHGFARDLFFNLISEKESELVFSTKATNDTKKVYPFNFELQIVYALKNYELEISYNILNTNSEALYYSIGGHPAFALADEFQNYSLQFEPDEELLSFKLENGLLSENSKKMKLLNNQLPLTYSLFEDDALIFKKLHSKNIQILENQIPILNFKFKDFPNFGIWTKQNAPFICLEPWIGYSDIVSSTGKIEEKEGIQLLQGNSSITYSFSIEIL